jgi:hypothetical protein
MNIYLEAIGSHLTNYLVLCSSCFNTYLPRAILELEMDRLSLRQKIFELNFALEDQEHFFNAQVSPSID